MARKLSSQGSRILIVEDDPNILISIEFLLRNAGYEVSVACDGRQALESARGWRPDLIVLDIMLPLVNGFEVCRQLRESHELNDVKILMLTARGRESEIEKGAALGANAYLTKPFATRELIETTQRLLSA
jgi:DNA-binding response OmpR family regulator